MHAKNRRSAPRHPFFGEATSIMPDKKEITALIANIAVKGLGVYSVVYVEEFIEIMVKIAFIFFFSKQQEIFLEGMVCWVNKKSDIYEVGIRFKEELNSENQPVLYKHIEAFRDILPPAT